MDEDGQHDPAYIGALLDRAYETRSQLVYAAPTNSPPHGFLRNAGSGIRQTGMFKWLVGDSDLEAFNSYRLILGEVGRSAAAYTGSGVWRSTTELAWIFNCVSSYGDVSRMTQFKDKSQQVNAKTKDAFISTGLFAYPVLQAADILIYKADFVPVGNDQDQHLELTRNIADRFNQIVGEEYFVLPETLYTSFPKVLSTADPSKKMSASLGPKHNISIFSDPNVIRKQIKSAVTDSGDTPLGQISPGVENLFSILKASGGHPDLDTFRENALAGTLQYGKLKEAVADVVIEMSEPFRQKRLEIVDQKNSYEAQIAASAEVIRKTASKTLREVKDLVGLMNINA